ncbi:WD repeat protein [Talaromyces proteolyticus]|uniref:WD repeat protein n=1 Tax=Talaromyces proteolyticus TaxID=1131652 RepID=A0AAD4KTD6_9EURO|nr:WD repeat protein [Talaromyces proteolyticus]KAH8696161.1 WD repeat protein [Talaromyces proteolyticus]
MADVTQQELQDQKATMPASDTPQVGTPLGPPPVPRSATPQPSQKVSDTILTYRSSKRFKLSKRDNAHITSLDFDDKGEYVVAACEDETIQVFDVIEGKNTKVVPSKKYGVHLARFTHHSRQILHASTKVDDSLRLLDLHQESYLRYFTGHTDKVTSLSLSPGGDAFVSSSKDNTISLWDLKSRNVQGKLQLATPYLVAFDPSASVIAVASQSTSSVLLYDFRNYDRAPFATFDMAPHEERYTPSTRGRLWSRLEFSNDGKSLLVGTDYHGHFVLDAFEGNVNAFLVGRKGSSGRAAPVSSSGRPLGQGDACFTQDGRYVLGGAGEQNEVLVWDTHQTPDSGSYLQPMGKIPSKGRNAIIELNPRYNMLATADKDIFFWLPDEGIKPSDK